MKQGTLALSIKKGSKRFPGTLAVDKVNFDIYPGEVHSVIGENGAGKSTLMKMINGLYNDYTGQIFINGKEKKLYSPLIAKENGIKTQLSINPILLTKANIRKIQDLDYLHISLDGTNQETLKKLRGRAADYEKSVKYIKNFLKFPKKPYSTIAIIRLKQTEKELLDFVEQWKNSGLNGLEVKEFTTWDGSKKSITSLASKKQLSYAFRKAMTYPCLRPWHRFTILWDGQIVPCCYDYDGKYILGDLKSQSLKQVWNAEPMRELRKQHITNDFSKNKLCKNCKEKYGMPASFFYPCNLPFLKRALKYLTQRLK